MCLDTFKKSVQPSLLVLTLLPNFIYKKKANLLLILGLFFIHLCLFQSRCWVSVWVQTSGLQLRDGWREVEELGGASWTAADFLLRKLEQNLPLLGIYGSCVWFTKRRSRFRLMGSNMTLQSGRSEGAVKRKVFYFKQLLQCFFFLFLSESLMSCWFIRNFCCRFPESGVSSRTAAKCTISKCFDYFYAFF